MASDLRFRNYNELLGLIRDMGLKPVTLTEYLEEPDRERICLLRHDVEWGCANSLQKATIEADRGIRATYYFHGPHRRKVFRPDQMRRFAELGHEIGYHYETLDQADGDFELARKIFIDEVQQFRAAGFPIRVVCAHGNPRKRKVGYKANYDLLTKYPDLLDSLGLIGEASTSFLPTRKLFSVTDTGATIKAFREGSPLALDGSVRALMDVLPSSEGYLLHILTHPDFWSRGWTRAAAISAAGTAAQAATGFVRKARALRTRAIRQN